MEAFVIKREDGKYLSKFFNYNYNLAFKMQESWTDNIYNAKLFSSMHNAVLHADRFHTLGFNVAEIKKVNLTIEELKNG
jgi:hypothetical protein